MSKELNPKATNGVYVQVVCWNIDAQLLTRDIYIFQKMKFFELICLILDCNECYSNNSIERSDTLQTRNSKRRGSKSLFSGGNCFTLLLKLSTDTYERKSLCPAWNEGKIRESSKHHPVSFTSKNATENTIIVVIFWTSCSMTQLTVEYPCFFF